MEMTLTMFNLGMDDDQLVPQVFSSSANDNSIYSVPDLSFGGVPQLGLQQDGKPLPDFDTLLTDLSQTLEAQLYQDYDLSTLKVMELDRIQALPQDEMTFYEDLPNGMVPIKTEKVDFSYQEHASVQQYSAQNSSQLLSEAAQMGNLAPVDSSDMDEVTSEIQGVCRHLDIPIDPYSWSVEQVQKWASWMLNKYQLPMHYANAFRLDGTNLCMLSDYDLKSRFPQFGDYLFAELEILKGAYTVSSGSPSPTHSDSIQDECQNSTYMDLDACSSQSSQQCCLQPAFISLPPVGDESAIPLNIPKPVFTAMTPSLSPAPSIDSMDSASGYGSSPSSLSIESEYVDVRTAVTGATNEIKATVTPTKQNIHLWQFLRELLLQPQSYSNCIRWLDRSKGVFKIEDSARVARLWGQRKNRPAMNYDKLSRSIRQYYKKGIIRKTDNSKRLVYQFCPQYRA